MTRPKYPHDVDKVRALLKSLCVPCDDNDEHTWRTCRRCLASEEIETESARKLLVSYLDWVDAQAVRLETAQTVAATLAHAYEHDSRPPVQCIVMAKEWAK